MLLFKMYECTFFSYIYVERSTQTVYLMNECLTFYLKAVQRYLVFMFCLLEGTYNVYSYFFFLFINMCIENVKICTYPYKI